MDVFKDVEVLRRRERSTAWLLGIAVVAYLLIALLH
jgi:hypothetical protein